MKTTIFAELEAQQLKKDLCSYKESFPEHDAQKAKFALAIIEANTPDEHSIMFSQASLTPEIKEAVIYMAGWIRRHVGAVVIGRAGFVVDAQNAMFADEQTVPFASHSSDSRHRAYEIQLYSLDEQERGIHEASDEDFLQLADSLRSGLLERFEKDSLQQAEMFAASADALKAMRA